MKVASVQIEIRDDESKEQRIDRMCAMLDKVRGCDLVVLPEIWATGYFSFDRYKQEAEPLDGPFVRQMSAKANELNLYLFAGSFVEFENGHYYNTSVLISPQGKVIGIYRKIHLFRYGSAEGEILTPGKEIVVVDTSLGKIGLSTCYDIRFPELYRRQVDLGAELLLVTAAWPHQRLAHWEMFNSIRALENQCYLISCNCTGTTRNVLLGGHSRVVDPWGITVATSGEHEDIVKAEIDVKRIKEIREKFPLLKHRVLTS